MKRVHPLTHNKNAIGTEECLDPSAPNYSEIIDLKIKWASMFIDRETTCNVYRAYVLGPLFRPGTNYEEFIRQYPEQMARYSGINSEDHILMDINRRHKRYPTLSALGRGHLEGLEVVFAGETRFEGTDATKNARALEALEIVSYFMCICTKITNHLS